MEGGPVHIPVMLREVLEYLDPKGMEGVLDLTLGAGGHSAAMLERLDESGVLVGLDQDSQILKIAAERLDDARVHFIHANFGDLSHLRERLPRKSFDVIFADLGVSSLHLDQADRGFSFRNDGPLDMRMDSNSKYTAEDFVHTASVAELTRAIREYGEERFAGRVARALVEARKEQRLVTTGQLADLVRKVVGSRGSGGIDPATRTFQGIRIAVNGELEVLDRFLDHFDPFLAAGGRIGFLSYHSLEDRRVKTAFRERHQRGDYESLTSRPIRPSEDEVRTNPRARSARLRVLRKH